MTMTFFAPPGANTIETKKMRLWHVYGDAVTSFGGAMLLDGPPGVGKTNLVESWRLTQQLPSVRIELGPTPSNGEVIDQLVDALQIPTPPRTTKQYLRKKAVSAWLAANPCIVVVDEAQSLGVAGFNQLRTLHDRTDARWTLVFVGAGVSKKMSRDPALMRRMTRQLHLDRLEGTELVKQLRKYHPLFAHADATLLHEVDAMLDLREWRGTPGGWALVAGAAVDLAANDALKNKTNPITTLTPSLASRAVALATGAF
jgi:hypothetical protein